MTPNLDLWLIGNCQVSALIDRRAAIVWGCVPRVDGEPIFSSLLSEPTSDHDIGKGSWIIEIDGCKSIRQVYRKNTPILVSTFEDAAGNIMEVIDFCPRRQRLGRIYRPTAFARILRPLKGAPRIQMKLRPTYAYGAAEAAHTFGSNHIRYVLDRESYRLTTDAPVSLIGDQLYFRLEKPLHFFFGPDETFDEEINGALERMLQETETEWKMWTRGLAIPPDWQDEVIRAAISLKLCQHEETGAIVAAITTSIPEHGDSERNWDYRYCWIRDAYYTVQALNRIGALDVLEGFLGFLRNIVEFSGEGHIQPVYTVLGEPNLCERTEVGLNGYRGLRPVRVGNQAYKQIQNDVYGQIILSNVQAFIDQRLFRISDLSDFDALERVGEQAYLSFDKKDSGLWEFRTKRFVHTYSTAMCWAACDRLSHTAKNLGLSQRADFWHERAQHIRHYIEKGAWRPDDNSMSATIDGNHLDASLIQLLDLQFFDSEDPRFQGTLKAIEDKLRRNSFMLRYATEDDFGMPKTAFNFCTFWLIEALHKVGRTVEARSLFEEMLSRRSMAGLLSEDIDPMTGELWGNYPQTYSLSGLINCALQLSRPWSDIR